MRRRLDTEMVRRGMVTSRTAAAQAIEAGQVAVGGRQALKPASLVLADDPIVLRERPRRFVSRGGRKLDAALDRFAIQVTDRRALDAGASTGGFTECLLVRGAAHVVAVDVGYGQLDWRLRSDPRVTVLDRTNVRHLTPDRLPYHPDLITADLSFISLRLVLSSLVACAAPEADLVLLVKPQFEAGREDVGPGGVVSDPDTWRRVLHEVARACLQQGAPPHDAMASPLLGPAGNAEFFLAARNAASGQDPPGLATEALDRAVAQAGLLVAGNAQPIGR